eukprot:2341095-Prymnesium_polylepis.2
MPSFGHRAQGHEQSSAGGVWPVKYVGDVQNEVIMVVVGMCSSGAATNVAAACASASRKVTPPKSTAAVALPSSASPHSTADSQLPHDLGRAGDTIVTALALASRSAPINASTPSTLDTVDFLTWGGASGAVSSGGVIDLVLLTT